MTEQHEIKISQIPEPYELEGTITIFSKHWKKRHLIFKNNKAYCFDKKNSKKPAKEYLELTKDTIVLEETNEKEKKQIFKFKSNIDLIVMKDDITNHLREKVNKLKHDYEIKKKRLEEEKMKSREQHVILSWEVIQQKISTYNSVHKHSTDYQAKSQALKSVFKEIGKESFEKYLIQILKETISTWKEEEVIEFFYKDVCEEDLEELGNYLGNRNKETNEIEFVFGNDEHGGHFIANVYKSIYKKYNLVWSELSRCLLVCIALWEMRSNSVLFETITLDLFEDFSMAQIVTFLHFYSDYEHEINVFHWCDLPEHIVTYLKKITWKYTKDQITSFISMITTMWNWETDRINKLKEHLLSN